MGIIASLSHGIWPGNAADCATQWHCSSSLTSSSSSSARGPCCAWPARRACRACSSWAPPRRGSASPCTRCSWNERSILLKCPETAACLLLPQCESRGVGTGFMSKWISGEEMLIRIQPWNWSHPEGANSPKGACSNLAWRYDGMGLSARKLDSI